MAATADEEGALTWAPASGEEMVEVGALWGEGREQETAGGLGNGSRERGLEGWNERRNRRTPTKYGHLGEVESLWDNKPTEPRFGCREDGDVCPVQE